MIAMATQSVLTPAVARAYAVRVDRARVELEAVSLALMAHGNGAGPSARQLADAANTARRGRTFLDNIAVAGIHGIH